MKLIDIAAELRHETDNAYLIFDGRMEIKKGDTVPSEVKMWVPKSQVKYDEDTKIFTMPVAGIRKRIYLKWIEQS